MSHILLILLNDIAMEALCCANNFEFFFRHFVILMDA